MAADTVQHINGIPLKFLGLIQANLTDKGEAGKSNIRIQVKKRMQETSDDPDQGIALSITTELLEKMFKDFGLVPLKYSYIIPDFNQQPLQFIPIVPTLMGVIFPQVDTYTQERLMALLVEDQGKMQLMMSTGITEFKNVEL